MMKSNLDVAKRYLATLERMGDCNALAEFFSPDVVQEEFPNRLFPTGAKRDLAAILDGCEQGKKVLSEQRYEINNAVVSGHLVIMEILWTGKLAVAVGTLPEGGEMKAHFAVFLEFNEGKIVAQRNYDCFAAW